MLGFHQEGVRGSQRSQAGCSELKKFSATDRARHYEFKSSIQFQIPK
jgi:hypothetical protein